MCVSEVCFWLCQAGPCAICVSGHARAGPTGHEGRCGRPSPAAGASVQEQETCMDNKTHTHTHKHTHTDSLTRIDTHIYFTLLYVINYYFDPNLKNNNASSLQILTRKSETTLYSLPLSVVQSAPSQVQQEQLQH